jgi:hypothetical protein
MTTPKPTVTQAGIAAAIWQTATISNNVILIQLTLEYILATGY